MLVLYIIGVLIMKISLYLQDRIVKFLLPEQISGSFSFDIDESITNKLINIEARNNNWVLYGTTDVKILNGNINVENIILTNQNFYVLQRENIDYLIFVEEIFFPGFSLYVYQNDMHLLIGNSENANINYKLSYLTDSMIEITNNDNQLKLKKNGNIPFYINKKIVLSSEYLLHIGDEVEIFGLRLIFYKNVLLISKLSSLLNINMGNAHITLYSFPPCEPLEDIIIKDEDLYAKTDYYSKSPRMRRLIENKKIKLSPPPKEGDSSEVPVILVIGPMLTMGVTSGTMLLNTLSKIYSKQASFSDNMPQLVTSGAMLVSMLVWPLVTQAYNRHMKKKSKKEIIDKYTEYLKEKKQELELEAKTQREILYENLIATSDCLSIIQNKSINFWDKRIDQKDFLVVRVGLGNEKLDVDIEYPDEGFTIEESELRKQADAVIAGFQYINNVPIGYSFQENKVTAVMGEGNKPHYFVCNMLLQLMTFYSYDDLKFVIFTNEKKKQSWEFLRYLNHTFSNDKSFRFFATDQESTKNVADYLQMQFHQRLSTITEGKSSLFKPYYFIIVDDYDRIKYHDLINLITENDNNLGFSLLILENKLSKLPSKCNNFITIGEKESGILKNSYENQQQISFQDEINPYIDLMSIAHYLANIPVEFSEGEKELPNAITFLEMEKVGKVEQLNILNRWNSNDSTTSLKAEVGVDERGELMYLDLHEKYHGPHGLIAGMTGSGKSEFIITYILSMAINYSPDDVAFILIDYKGGGLAFAFENKTQGIVLPHLAGTITNLDKAEMDRTLVSIDSEIKRRQQIFNEARDKLGQSTIDIYKYQRFFKEGKLSTPVPHLFIICDEFAELKSQQPEFMDNLISVARIGRSLGVHLILATQKPSGVVNDQIWSNTKFRVCLKVQDEQDSREMLKRPEAASLKQVGRYYLQVGYDELFLLGQSAWCGAKYYPSDQMIKAVDKSINFINDNGMLIKSIQASSNVKLEAKGEQLSAVIQSIITIANQTNKHARKLWLDNIPSIITLDLLVNKYGVEQKPYHITAILGEYDAPEKQEQGLVCYSYLKDGNMIIYGNDGAERENLLSACIYTSVKEHSADEINYYIMDYGSEFLRIYNNLPHVGGMVFAGEDEKYHNLLKLLREELQKRKKLLIDYGGDYENYINTSSSKLPLLVVILNNYDSIYEANPSLYDELPELLRDSERYGIIYIFTAGAVNSIQSKLSQNCSTIFAFKLKDVSDYTSLFGVRVKNWPRDVFGRGFLKTDTVHEFQTLSICDDSSNTASYLQDFVKNIKISSTSKAKRIPTLPDIIRLNDIDDEITDLHSIPVGISKKELDVITIDYLANVGNIITSNKLANTEKFVRSLLTVFTQISGMGLIVIDPMKLLKLDINNYPNYYTNQLVEVLDKLIMWVNQLQANKSDQSSVILIYGFNKFIAKVKESNKFDSLVKALRDYEKISLIIVDDAAKIKTFTFEPWFSSTFSINDGIWIGRGLSDQNLLHLSTITRDMTNDYKNNMGYVVMESMGVLCKYIDFISKEEQGDEK